MASQEIQVPDIGDFTDVPVIEVHVAAGDTAAVDDPLLTLESDKATLSRRRSPAPCPSCNCSDPHQTQLEAIGEAHLLFAGKPPHVSNCRGS